MHYLSTRGATEPHSFADVLLGGLARDGGLFMPESWPRIPAGEIAGYASASYQDVAFRILERFAGASFADADLKADIDAAYAAFDAPDVAPLVEIGTGSAICSNCFTARRWPSKTLRMQLLGRLFARALAKRGGRATVLAATSGDTGSAAIAALRRTAEHRRLRAASAGPGERGAAAPDDDSAVRQCAQHRAAKAASTTRRRS